MDLPGLFHEVSLRELSIFPALANVLGCNPLQAAPCLGACCGLDLTCGCSGGKKYPGGIFPLVHLQKRLGVPKTGAHRQSQNDLNKAVRSAATFLTAPSAYGETGCCGSPHQSTQQQGRHCPCPHPCPRHGVLWVQSTGHAWQLLSNVQGVKPWAGALWPGHWVYPGRGLGKAACLSSGDRFPLCIAPLLLSCSGKQEKRRNSQLPDLCSVFLCPTQPPLAAAPPSSVQQTGFPGPRGDFAQGGQLGELPGDPPPQQGAPVDRHRPGPRLGTLPCPA